MDRCFSYLSNLNRSAQGLNQGFLPIAGLSSEHLTQVLEDSGVFGLEQEIDQLMELAGDDESEMDVLNHVNEWLSNRKIFRVIFEANTKDPARHQWCMTESSINPNGFFRVMLLSGEHFKN